MSVENQIKSIRQFIEWREERGDMSGLEVSLDVYAEWLATEDRRTLAQRALDILGGLEEGVSNEEMDEVRAALKAAL